MKKIPTSLYACVILFHVLGLDDKNIVLFLTSPPFWILEQHAAAIPIWVIYLVTLLFYFLIGALLDWGIRALRRSVKKDS